MGLVRATATVAGIIIGASIFVQPSVVLRHVSGAAGAYAAWALAGALTLVGALVAAELTAALPRSGGVYVFLGEAWSPALGFLWGWAMFWSMHSGIVAAIAMVLGRYAGWFVPLGPGGTKAVAIAAILLLSAVNYRGVREGSALQTALTVAKVGAVVAIVAVGFALGPRTAPAAAAPAAAGSVSGFVLALGAGLFAFGGWHMVTYTAGETVEPQRTIPRALVIGVLLVSACYLALNAVYFRLLPLAVVRSSTRVAADAADAALGRGGGAVMAGVVVLSTLGALNGVVLTGPRVYHAMARDGVLFRWLGEVHERFRTPHRATLLQAAWASVLVATGTYETLFAQVVYTEWIFFALMAAGLLALRRRARRPPALGRGRRAPAPPRRLRPCLRPARRAAAAGAVHRGRARRGRRADPGRERAGPHRPRAGRARRPRLLSDASAPPRLTRSREPAMTVIDFHDHFYPPQYLDALRAGTSHVRVVVDRDGNPELHYPGDYNVAVQGHRDIAYRETVLAKEGVDLQVLTLTTPGTHVEAPARAVELARLVNDAFAAVVRERGRRFAALATLPLNDPAASARELRRAVEGLGFKGAMLFSNVNGVALADPRYDELYRTADQLEAILHIHPTNPVGVEAMTDFWLMPLVGFPMDTTLAAAKLVFSGVVERYPRIRWVLSHLGGAIPYIAERLDRGHRAFRECRAHISRPPSEYLKRFFYDTVNFDPGSLKLAIAFAGASQILAGSDYPHQIGSIPSMLQSLRALDIPDAGRAAILGGNAARLLAL